MTHRHPTDHPCFPLLLVWRAICGLLALHAVVDQPFEAMLMALGGLGALALAGEALYARKVAADQRRLREQAERELRQRRAEEARQRYEAAQEAQKNEGGRSFGLDEAAGPATAPMIHPAEAVELARHGNY
ncbi:MAG TPA: hypothetical protein VF096_09390 [Azonexus sp.]